MLYTTRFTASRPGLTISRRCCDGGRVNRGTHVMQTLAPSVVPPASLVCWYRLMKRASWDYQSAVRGICANLQVNSHPLSSVQGRE